MEKEGYKSLSSGHNHQEQTEENYNRYHSPADYYLETPALRCTYSGISNSSTSSFCLITARSFEEIDNMKFLDTQTLSQSMQKLIDSLCDKMWINQKLIVYLLYKYKWNKQKLEDQYYVDSEQFIAKDMFLKNLCRKQKDQSEICPICQNNSKLIKGDFCQHSYCGSCWKNYIQEKLNENQLFFCCMNNCKQSPVIEPFIQFISPPLIEVFLKKLVINYCLANKNITYCPSSHCSVFCEKPETLTQCKVECPCGNIYCFYCRKDIHPPLTCDEVLKWQARVNLQQNNNQWMRRNTMVCPQCRNNVEKSVGCDMMKCICGCEFCFNCSVKWDENHKLKKECPKMKIKLQKRLSHHQKQLVDTYEKVIQITNSMKKDIKTIEQCIRVVNEVRSDGKYQNELAGLKNKVIQAWLIRKWGLIGKYIYLERKHDDKLQQNLVQSIAKLMDQIKAVLKQHYKMTPKQLHIHVDEIITRKQQMIKHCRIFEDQWHPC